MTYMRVTRDQRGYETTYLLHTPRPGERPRILYWYRTAPGVRVGRKPLDEEAIRTIEEQHPEIEFDWPALLEEAESVEPEVERRPERPRKRRPQEGAEGRERRLSAEGAEGAERRLSAEGAEGAERRLSAEGAEGRERRPSAEGAEGAERRLSAEGVEGRERRPSADTAERSAFAEGVERARRNPLLDQLVGREIAGRLRDRYAHLVVRLAQLPAGPARESWLRRADALDPDRWDTPQAVLDGIQRADRLYDELKRELPIAE